MRPPPFRYTAPTTVAEAVELLVEHADTEARVLAGGQSLVPMMNFRLAQPGHLIDLRRVDELAQIRHRRRHAGDRRDGPAVGRRATRRRSRSPPRCWPRRSGTSRTRRSATAAPSAAASRTPTRPPSCPPSRSRWTPSSSWPARADRERSRPPSSSAARSRPRSRPTRSSPRCGCPGGPAVTRSSSSPASTATFALVGVAVHRRAGRRRRLPRVDRAERGRADAGARRRRRACPGRHHTGRGCRSRGGGRGGGRVVPDR